MIDPTRSVVKSKSLTNVSTLVMVLVPLLVGSEHFKGKRETKHIKKITLFL